VQLWNSKHKLSAEQQRFWEENGYLVLSGFFDPKQVNAVNAVVERVMANPASLGSATVDVLHEPHVGKRFRASEAPRDAFDGPIKINDLFLQEPEVRALALSKPLTKILSKLLGGDPMICNSLNLCGAASSRTISIRGTCRLRWRTKWP
jgi:hypothetical protein